MKSCIFNVERLVGDYLLSLKKEMSRSMFEGEDLKSPHFVCGLQI